MEWLSYSLTVLGLTLPLAVGFAVIGVIIVGLGVLGGELYTESDSEKRLRPRDADLRKHARRDLRRRKTVASSKSLVEE
jgi:hypothetical protein